MNRTIIVTGATGSIGNVTCHYLASKSYDLILISKTAEKLEVLKSKLASTYNIKVDYVVIDFDYEYNVNVINQIYSSFNNISGLVLMPPKIAPTNNCLPSNQTWANTFRRTFIHPLDLLKHTIPYLQSYNGRSKIVIVSGISSVQVMSNYAINNAIRAAWLGQAKTLASFYGDKNVHVNTVSFGGIMTEELVKNLKYEALDSDKSIQDIMASRVDNVPLKKYASLDEVSSVIETLLSNFTDHITGSNIICDGGFIKTY